MASNTKKRPCDKTGRRPADRRGEVAASARSCQRVKGGAVPAASDSRHQEADMHTDCGPEDVIRWAAQDCYQNRNSSGDTSGKVNCSETQRNEYYYWRRKNEENGPTTRPAVQVMQHNHRQQRDAPEDGRVVASGGRAVVADEECGTTRQSFNSNCLAQSVVMLRCSQPSLLVTVLLCTFLMLSSGVAAGRQQQDVSSNCTFPQRWEGTWFQSGLQQPIVIKGSKLSFRGTCIASDGDKFLMADDKCRRCVVIYEKHKNVLQYKESFCRGRESLQNLCEQIPGDALLYSMFKENAEPVRCPLKGPFTFTYNRGHGECGDPVSNIESCTEDSRLLLSFQACPDVTGTESTVEELTCLATWKDGNSRYLVGLVSHHHATSNEERYRCFVYEKIAGGGGSKEAEYKLAQSGDATCNGLDSAEVGSRIMTLRKAPAADRCDFPQWFKGRKHWHSIMGNYGYAFHQSDGSMHITKSNGVLETRALCEQINKQTSNEMMAVVHYTTGCQSGFMCMVFYRRDTHVAEIQMGSQAMRLEDACAPDHFDINKLQFVTLLASNPESEVCPIDGLYGLRGQIGPPFIPSRHKRNHNQRSSLHNNHSLLGHETALVAGAQQQQQHRRHIQSSFRSSSSTEQLARHSWKSPTRGVAVRNRRDTDHVAEETRIRRDAGGCVVNYNSRRQLLVGCTETNVIEVRPYCTEDNDEVYTCHGSWTHNGTQFIVAKHVGSQHGVCMSYRTIDSGSAQLIIGDVCLRSPQQPMEHHLVANLTVYDHTGMDREAKCSDTNGSGRIGVASTVTSFLVLIVAVLLLDR